MSTSFKVRDRVRHKHFGDGRVLRITPEGHLVIEFGQGDVRTIQASGKILEKLDGPTLNLNVSLLDEILAIESLTSTGNEMLKVIKREIAAIIKGSGAKIGESMDTCGNLYLTKPSQIPKSQLYPCIVANLETIYKVGEGDANIGVYICLEMLRYLDAVKIVFFRGSTLNGCGSVGADMSRFHDVSFVLQAAQPGTGYFVRCANGYELFESNSFYKTVWPTLEKHGYYAYEKGEGADVLQLKLNGLDVCCANVTYGYEFESIDEHHVTKCLNLCYDLLDGFCYKKWEHSAGSRCK